ncbi:MAG: hypothetical protein KGY75_08795, partial [Candidatus Cloacimonetes bacterium]|nr:hypothetical protein [Candidatus Cloacimonadota bacterium]
MNEQKSNELISIINNPNIFKNNNELKQISIKNNFIIDKEINEDDIIRINIMKNSFDTTNLDLKISLTERCNFKCDYCFVANNSIYKNINKEIMDSIINLVKNSKN